MAGTKGRSWSWSFEARERLKARLFLQYYYFLPLSWLERLTLIHYHHCSPSLARERAPFMQKCLPKPTT